MKAITPGTVYYIGECGCQLEKHEVIKRKRYDILNGRQPMINSCPEHADGYIETRICKCIVCHKVSVYKPGGGISERCAPCGVKHSHEKAKAKYESLQLLKKKDAPVIEHEPIRFGQESMKKFRWPRAALTMEQAALRNVHFLPLESLFLFHREMIVGVL